MSATVFVGATSGILTAALVCYILEVTVVRKLRVRRLMRLLAGGDTVLDLLILLTLEI
jgi:hypothetical protein